MGLDGVGRTALGMALVRARETRHPDRLFDDPLAEAFLAADPHAFPEERQVRDAGPGAPALAALGAAFFAQGVLRTRFFDDHLGSAALDGCRQLVLLAAGLDTRAYRLEWPAGTRLFELDLPEVLAFKAVVLSAQSAVPRCERTEVPADLRAGWVSSLTRCGFDPAVPTAWLAEGLLIYLSADEASTLLHRVDDLSAPGSRLSFEQSAPSDALLSAARAAPSMGPYTAMWKGGLGQDATALLHRLGWTTRLHDIGDVARGYGRAAPPDATGGFVTAVR